MGVQEYPIGQRNLDRWFLDISNHLDSLNWDKGDWPVTPAFTGLTGSPTITGTFVRQGTLLYFAVIVDGTSSTSSAYINNLPFVGLQYGRAEVFNITVNADIGSSYIDQDTTDVYVPDWDVTSKKLLITGITQIKGL